MTEVKKGMRGWERERWRDEEWGGEEDDVGGCMDERGTKTP
jgi:hypothetical protein